MLTNAPPNEAHSIWYDTPVSTGSFTVTFTYESNPPGSQTAYQVDNGMALVLLAGGVGNTASLGSDGPGLGYAGITAPSVAYEININNGPVNGTGTETPGTNLATDGATGTYHSTAPVNVNDGNEIVVTLTYNASAHTLTESLKSSTNPAATYSHTYTGIDLAALLGPTAILGFTGSTGPYGLTQLISNFSSSGTPLPSGINLTAGNTINVTGNISGVVNASAPNGVVLDQKTGSLTIGELATSAPKSAVNVTAAGSILDGTGGHGPNLFGPVISLTSQTGSIGTPTHRSLAPAPVPRESTTLPKAPSISSALRALRCQGPRRRYRRRHRVRPSPTARVRRSPTPHFRISLVLNQANPVWR